MLKIVLLISSLLVTFNVSLASPNYCAAIRGNGELIPAHWGAMGRIVETWGMPKAMAGGSSAAITLFFIESIAANKLLSEWAEGDENKLKSYQSLLVKSLQGYIEFLASQKEIQEIEALIASEKFAKILAPLKDTKTGSHTEDLTSAIQIILEQQKIIDDVLKKLDEHGYFPLLNPEFLGLITGVISDMQELKKLSLEALVVDIGQFVTLGLLDGKEYVERIEKLTASLQFKLKELKDSVAFFGDFASWNDKHLFFRAGIIHFAELGRMLSRTANFLAGYGFDESDKENFSHFVKTCGEQSVGRTWIGPHGLNPTNESPCRLLFFKALSQYREKLMVQNWKVSGDDDRFNELVGKHVPSFVSTSIIKDSSVKRFQSLHKKYLQGMKQDFGSFKVSFKKELFFGYWGQSKDLKKAETNLHSPDGFEVNGRHYNYSNDLKSQKFLSLGEATWETALALSPAEPGLSRVLPFPNNPDYLSAGGWTDLHPSLVLRANGCKNVIYITRRDGESLFVQGVIHRLTDIEGIPVDKLSSTDDNANKYNNNSGDEHSLSSEWAQLYNLANPNSSLALSISESDGVYCTNWNSFDIKKKDGLSKLIHDAYSSRIYMNENNPTPLVLDSNFKQLFKEDNVEGPGGYKEFAGCIPL